MRVKRKGQPIEELELEQIRALGPLLETTKVEVGEGNSKRWVPGTRFSPQRIEFNPGGESVAIVE